MLPAVAALATSLAACAGEGGGRAGGGQTGGEVTVRAMNDPEDVSIAVLMYLPQSIRVNQGTTVAWALTGPERHSVTFFPAGETLPAAGSDPSLLEPRPADAGVHDPRAWISSGLAPSGPEPPTPFRLRFDTTGKWTYYCVLHPGMLGTVDVVATGARADTPAEVLSRGDRELQQWVAEGREAKRRLTSGPPVSTRNADGSITWTVEMGASTGHTSVLAFAPVAADIRPGDRITFVNNSHYPHTATFPGLQELPDGPPSPDATLPRPGPSPVTLNPTDLFATGTVPPDAPGGGGLPAVARSFTFVLPESGDYPYVCLYHHASAMAGLIRVA